MSPSGAVSAPDPAAGLVYTCTGTDADTFGNTGTWMFTLTTGPNGGQIPESPLVIGLPLAAVLLGGAAFWMNRRRRRPALWGDRHK